MHTPGLATTRETVCETAGMVRFRRATSRDGGQEHGRAGNRTIAIVADDTRERPRAIAGICEDNRRREERGQQGSACQRLRCVSEMSDIAPNLFLAFAREQEQDMIV
jgi:hypothetical protein